MHEEDLREPLALVAPDVEDLRRAVDRARVDPEISQLGVLVGLRLEGEGAEGRLGIGLALAVGPVLGDRVVLVVSEHLALRPRDLALDRREVDRGRQVVADPVQDGLDSLAALRRPAEDRGHLHAETEPSHRGADLLGRDLLLGEVLLGDLLVEVGDPLEHLDPRDLGVRLELLGDLDDGRSGRGLVPLHVLPDEPLHLDQVHDAPEGLLLADRDLEREGLRVERLVHVLQDLGEVGADPVELVDEDEARDVVAVRLLPDRLGLGLHALDSGDDDDRSVEHAERPLDLGREVHVAGRVDDVDPELGCGVGLAAGVPVGRDGGRDDRDPALALLREVVRRRVPLVDVPEPVLAARVEEDALGRRRLPGVYVGDDPDVARALERETYGVGVAGLSLGHGRVEFTERPRLFERFVARARDEPTWQESSGLLLGRSRGERLSLERPRAASRTAPGEFAKLYAHP